MLCEALSGARRPLARKGLVLCLLSTLGFPENRTVSTQNVSLWGLLCV